MKFEDPSKSTLSIWEDPTSALFYEWVGENDRAEKPSLEFQNGLKDPAKKVLIEAALEEIRRDRLRETRSRMRGK